MRLITYSAILGFLVTSVVAPAEADAQQCRRRVIVGPGVTVVGPCQPAPPVVVVQPVPPPPPPTAAPAPPPPPPVMNQANPCVQPPPRRYYRRPYYRYRRRPTLFTVGLYGEGTMFEKGGLGGAGFYAQFRMTRGLHLYGSIGAAGSCTACSEDNFRRTDLKTSVGLQYYFLRSRRWQPYLRGTIVYQNVTYRDPLRDSESEPVYKMNQLGGELALGIEWRIARWLSIGFDVAYLGLGSARDEEDVPLASGGNVLPEDRMKGVPAADGSNHGVNFRFTAALRF